MDLEKYKLHPKYNKGFDIKSDGWIFWGPRGILVYKNGEGVILSLIIK